MTMSFFSCPANMLKRHKTHLIHHGVPAPAAASVSECARTTRARLNCRSMRARERRAHAARAMRIYAKL